ncbi:MULTISPECIES: winged helix-turn-helix transcriptional regulator [Amycolatopsis]|uniref:Winged helix-turn-helix transcriptional regulator n=1 Tax=Amycolatopsis albidoflavus TaxID=102226 RepID=A0ABW5IGR6_9PSEU
MVTGDARFLQRSRDLRHLLNGEWITHTLVALSAGPLHYNELYAAIQEMTTFDPWTGSERKIQSRALGRTLRRMETAGLVDRVEERTFPRSVVYSLTKAAADLLDRSRPLIDWAEENLDLIERLQRAQADGEQSPDDEQPD